MTPQIEKILAEIVEKLKREYQPEKIILYGSYAYGNPTRDSDIDLFIVKDTDRNRVERFVEIKTLIYDPQRKISVQPLVLTPGEVQDRMELGDDFITEIVKQGQILYTKDGK